MLDMHRAFLSGNFFLGHFHPIVVFFQYAFVYYRKIGQGIRTYPFIIGGMCYGMT